MFSFLEILILEIIPKIQSFNGFEINKKNISIVNFKIPSILFFSQLEQSYEAFKLFFGTPEINSKISGLDISIKLKNI